MGVMFIGISTRSVELNEKNDSIELTAKYAMDINNNFIADCAVCVTAKPREAGLNLTS